MGLSNRQYDVFISYRRATCYHLAASLYELLEARGVRTFFDKEGLLYSAFWPQIRDAIRSAPCFLLLLAKRDLDKCGTDAGDWLKKEILEAASLGSNMVIVAEAGFEFTEELKAGLPEEICWLPELQHITYSPDYRHSSQERIYFTVKKCLMENRRWGAVLRRRFLAQFWKTAAVFAAVVLGAFFLLRGASPPTETTALPAAEEALKDAPPTQTPAPVRDDDESPPAPVAIPVHEEVLIPAGTVRVGAWDGSRLGALAREHGDSPSALLNRLLLEKPRTARIQSFFLSRAPITNREYARFLRAVEDAETAAAVRHPGHPDGLGFTPAFWEDAGFNRPAQPVVGVSWYAAYAYCHWSGGRLPTRDEWEAAARGSDGRLYPWGDEFEADAFAPVPAARHGPVDVQAMDTSREPFGTWGMGGNVAEWTADGEAGKAVVCGAAWEDSDTAPLRAAAFYTRLATKRFNERPTLGFRLVRKAADGAGNHDMVEVEGGEYRLGGEDTYLLALARRSGLRNPAQVFYGIAEEKAPVGAFFVDKYEVSNSQYRRFLEHVEAKGSAAYAHPDQPPDKSHVPRYWDNPAFNQDGLPVVGVDWFDAYAYAKWAGRRLPTALEWERAARGDTARLYPWGSQFSGGLANTREERSTLTPTDVERSFPGDATPRGVRHLCGNVREWTADAAEGRFRLLKGASYLSSGELEGIVFLRTAHALPAARNNFLGFRTVRDAE